MSLHAVLIWLAQQLQVQAPMRWSCWWLRLFVLPPVGQIPVLVDPQQVPNPRVWAAQQLGVPPTAVFHLWLLRLVLLPPQGTRITVAQALGGALLAVLQLIGSCIAWVWHAIGWILLLALWPVRKALALFEQAAMRINFESIVHQTDRLLGPMLAIPVLRWALLGLAVVIGAIGISTPFSLLGQFFFFLLCWAISMVLRRLQGQYISLALNAISMFSLGRYFWWRMTTTLEFDSYFEALLGIGLLAAEAYTWIVVVLSFLQNAWPLKRQPVPLPSDAATWPTIDVFIPTYNEPLSVVRPTTLAALALDWPKDKLRIYILDDGRREVFREFALSMGINYMIRPDNKHAKAGNLNHALKQTDGELVAIFDCDHLPTRGFLKTCVGWFQRDPKCAMLQTPHHFFSPDPFERNLGTFRRVPNEGALFYGLIQDCNDFWNASFFCGSCAVLRREPLMEVGGIAVETVTEDAHTALKMHRLGYTTAYLNQTLAAGLATESLSAHVGQRIRWARGMAQIFRVDNPFLGKGLTVWQRICYSSAMMGFFFGLPRLVFLTSPLAYLLFEFHIINANAMVLALYVLPYILQSNIANSHMQGKHRHAFWAEVYETVLAAYLILPTVVALVNPKAGTFNVTAKGGLVSKSYFDWAISAPYAVLVLLSFVGFGLGLLRLFIFNTYETTTVLLNLVWNVYSILILGAALGVASESRQVRKMHRVDTRMTAVLYLDDGQVLHCECMDYSMTGLGLSTLPGCSALLGDHVSVGLWSHDMECTFPAKVVIVKPGLVGVQFDELTREQEINLVQCTFAHPDAWSNWNETNDTDKPLHGLLEITQLGLRSYKNMYRSLRDQVQDHIRQQRAKKDNA